MKMGEIWKIIKFHVSYLGIQIVVWWMMFFFLMWIMCLINLDPELGNHISCAVYMSIFYVLIGWHFIATKIASWVVGW